MNFNFWASKWSYTTTLQATRNKFLSLKYFHMVAMVVANAQLHYSHLRFLFENRLCEIRRFLMP